jgi:hypothetical protein
VFILGTYEIQRRFEANEVDSIAVAAHPGLSFSSLADHLFPSIIRKLMTPFFRQMLQSSAMGALPSIRAAVDPEVSGGQYFGPDGPDERKGYPVVVQSSAASHNEADARRLWEVSEQLTGVRYLSG